MYRTKRWMDYLFYPSMVPCQLVNASNSHHALCFIHYMEYIIFSCKYSGALNDKLLCFLFFLFWSWFFFFFHGPTFPDQYYQQHHFKPMTDHRSDQKTNLSILFKQLVYLLCKQDVTISKHRNTILSWYDNCQDIVGKLDVAVFCWIGRKVMFFWQRCAAFYIATGRDLNIPAMMSLIDLQIMTW